MCKPPGKSLAKDLAPGECRVTLPWRGENSCGGDDSDDDAGDGGDMMVVMVMKMVKWW